MKKLLVVVDMVNGFIKKGAMADPYINTITPEVENLMRSFIENKNGEVIAFCDSHTLDSEEFKNYPIHCLKGTKESELIEELQPFQKDITIFEKDTTNGFIEETYQEYLRENIDDIEEIVVVGCCSDICVLNYAISQKEDFASKGISIPVIVPKNAIETFENEEHSRKEANKDAIIKMLEKGIHVVDNYNFEKERVLFL